MNRGLFVALAGLALAAVYAGTRTTRARQKRVRPVFDYSDRSGFPKPPGEMRGIARRQASRAITA